MLIGHPTHAPQTHRLRPERQDPEPRRAHEEHGLVCFPDRIEALGVPAHDLWDPPSQG